ncbi:hypothetical protein AB1Y20_011985 [Prymnesium parvum]|uniref:Alpha-L-rhamnosidase n=1 Tax=Prymnesium parvum TaxID=97485 RepID=A0AB34IPX8_PRYPA
MRLLLLCGCLLHAAGAETAWHTISSVLLREPVEYLPTVPSHAAAAAIYSGVAHTFSGGYPFASYSVSMSSTGSAPSDVDTTVDPLSGLCNRSLHAPVLAGPLFTCPASGACSGPQLSTGALLCRASYHTPSVQLGGVVGTYWARAVASPAWAQYIFPAVPAGATTLTLRFKLDARYRPELYGGNPCANASAAYNCSLCTDGAWDFSQPAGFYALWSAAGRHDYVISGPHGGLELGLQFDAGILTHILEAPAALSLSPGEFPVVAFFIYSQYLAAGEVAYDAQGRCSVTWSGEYPGAPPYKGRPLMIEKATLLYRSGLAFPTQPPVGRPRLYGSNDVWYRSRVMPFFHAPCDAEAAPDAGWFEEAGVFDVKSHFEYAARGFRSCTQPAIDGADIAAYHPARKYLQYLSGGESPSFVDGRRALHLVRRLWSCYEHGGVCEYNSSQALRLATALVAVEMARWEGYVWTCGVQCGGTPGSVAFDLTTSEPVAYFSLWYDVLSSQAGLVPAGNASVVASMLRSQIDLFRDAFWFGEWTLWNGNNWTPHLCTAALMWAIAFFHEDDAALEVVAMVNDIMWLHRKYYLPDGTYVEGVVVYSIMSISGLLQMASMQRPSFGAAPEAVDVDALRAVVRYQLASMATDGYAVDFGDSHSRRGWTETSTLDAAMASQIVLDAPTHARQPSIDACELRAHSASAYGSSSTGVDPWVLDPALLDLNISARVKSGCYDAHASRPLGGPRISLFPDGGYAAIRLPLLPENRSGAPCFGSGAQQRCIDPSRPSLFDNVPYVHLSLQARSNSFAHSEVDFGTLVWSAWGSRLISDFGYGTIATAVGDWDTRRYEYIDNNPAGHSTVVVKEAFTSTGSRINFSQMNKGEAGSISLANVSRDDSSDASRCVELDGSVVYGSTRPDGWLDQMRRYACPLDAEAANRLFPGAILLIDVIRVKQNREPLSIYGATYGGPNFNELAPAGQQLHIEEYFYTDTAATLASDGDGNLIAEELPFNREALGSGGKWVRHVDVEVVSPHLVSLTPASGIGAYRDADGIGVVAGYATRGGNFTYDGVITSVNVWGEEHAYKKRRFRFVGDGPIDSDGDVRAFVLAPSAANQLSLPNVTLTSCGGALGCASNDAPVLCSCISICIGGDLHWTAVIDGKVKALRRVGNCSDDAADLLSPELVRELNDHVQLPTLAPTPTPTAAPTAAPTTGPTPTPTAAPTTAPGGGDHFVSTIDFEALQASGENRLEVSWTRGAPSHAVSSVYWPAMQTASTCEGCSRGPLMLRQSGGLGLHLLSGGPSLYAYICWTQSAGVQFRQAQSHSGSSYLSTDDGSVICADSNSIKLLSECSVGYVQLGLGPDGTLHSANRSLGCLGVPGGSASASAGYSATLAFGASFCIDGVDAAVWSLWANPYEPPGVSWTTRSALPSPQSSQGSTRWSIPLQIGLSENFRGGFGLEATAAGLSATNPSSGVQVVFPSGAYVGHAAWGGNTAFLFPTSSQAEYDSVGAALLSSWQSAFPSGSTIVFGPSPNATADACSVSGNERYTGFADAGSTSWCFTYADVDLDNYLNISLARGAVQLAMTPDAPDGSFISQLVNPVQSA